MSSLFGGVLRGVVAQGHYNGAIGDQANVLKLADMADGKTTSTPTPAPGTITQSSLLAPVSTPTTSSGTKADDDAARRLALAQNTIVGSTATSDRLGGS